MAQICQIRTPYAAKLRACFPAVGLTVRRLFYMKGGPRRIGRAHSALNTKPNEEAQCL
jgi:hypothetical protein